MINSIIVLIPRLSLIISFCHYYYPVSHNDNLFSSTTVSAIITSIVASIFISAYIYIREDCKFSGLSGNYRTYGWKEDDKPKEQEKICKFPEPNGEDTIDLSNPINKAVIKHLSKNKLEIILIEILHSHQWTGLIVMENENFGTVTWHYNMLNGNALGIDRHRFGYKRIIFQEREWGDSKVKVVYLIGEIFDGYGKEILIEDTQNK